MPNNILKILRKAIRFTYFHYALTNSRRFISYLRRGGKNRNKLYFP